MKLAHFPQTANDWDLRKGFVPRPVSVATFTQGLGCGRRASGSLKSLDLGLEELPGKVDTALDRTQRFLEHFGYLMIFKPVEIKQKWIAEDLRQLVDRGL